VSEKSTRNNLDYTVESRRRGIAPFFDRNPALPCHTAEEPYDSSESGLKKEIPASNDKPKARPIYSVCFRPDSEDKAPPRYVVYVSTSETPLPFTQRQ